MDLGERKKKILGAVIEHYIRTAEPVGSRTISKLDELGVSSATIRNEMADLEEMGLLTQPHTSAGRIPSTMGYRTYVDRLMKRYEFSVSEINRLRSLMELELTEVDTMIKELTNIYSYLTNYTIVGSSAGNSNGYIKNFHMVQIDRNSALLIVVTDKNIVKNKKIDFDCDIDSTVTEQISNMLNENLAGVIKSKINLDKIYEIQAEMDKYKTVLLPVLNFVNECIESLDNSEVFISGASKLLDFPEYSNVQKAKELLEFLDNKENLHRMAASVDNADVKIIIGSENDALELKDCSIVLSSYSIKGKGTGTIGFIGPTRMNYSKAVSTLKLLTGQIDKLTSNKEPEGEK
ncbi:MAG: heat-inducible transcription repressor HrcA [Clostridia bacterium]|nr:heat-inducible transcription repressor HrcA [Clostridia bacterium]